MLSILSPHSTLIWPAINMIMIQHNYHDWVFVFHILLVLIALSASAPHCTFWSYSFSTDMIKKLKSWNPREMCYFFLNRVSISPSCRFWAPPRQTRVAHLTSLLLLEVTVSTCWRTCSSTLTTVPWGTRARSSSMSWRARGSSRRIERERERERDWSKGLTWAEALCQSSNTSPASRIFQ